MSDRENIAASLNEFNADARQFADDTVNAMTGQEHTELVADCEHAQFLAEELQGLLGRIATRSKSFSGSLERFGEGNDRQGELKARARELLEGSSLDLTFSTTYLNFGVVEMMGIAFAGGVETADASRTVGKVKGDLAKYTRGLRSWAEISQDGIRKQAGRIDEKITEWKELH